MSRIQNLWESRRYGIYYLLDRILVYTKLRKEQSIKAKLKKQEYFLKMDSSNYSKELKKWYKQSTGKDCDLENPVTFTEKIQWLKLYDSTKEKTELADKYSVRKWIANEIGEKYLIPLLGVWDNADDIDFNKLPEQFVLKCNHGAGMNIVVKDKSKEDLDSIKNKLNNWLKLDFGLGLGTFELHYSNIRRKIIAEEYIEDEENDELKDYKFFCFNGNPYFCQVICDRSKSETIDFYDMEWNHLPFTGLSDFPNSSQPNKCPIRFKEMQVLAQKLSANFSFVRVDFYEANGQLYFGEMTFTPAAGAGRFKPENVNKKMGQLLKLPKGDNVD